MKEKYKYSDYIIFDPFQMEVYGGITLKEDGYIFRYYNTSKFFFKSIFVPCGPAVKSIEALKELLGRLDKFHFSKIKIDLPLILDSKLENEVKNLFKSHGYRDAKYLMDLETLILTRDNFSLNSRNLRYVRKGLRDFDIEIVEEISDDDLAKIYDLYSLTAKRIGYKPKPLETMKALADQGISSIARDKKTGEISGFLICYLNNFKTNDKVKGVRSEDVRSLQLMLTGVNQNGLNAKLGFALHYQLFNFCFDNDIADIIDFHGASRSQQRTYIEFKKAFGGEFFALPGAYEKIVII